VRATNSKNEYVRGCPKWPATQIWLLGILGVKLSIMGVHTLETAG
jgi:hypothetical protein